MIHKINKGSGDNSSSSGSSSGFSFGSSGMAWAKLWEEATNAVEAIIGGIADLGKTRSNNSANTEQLYWLKAREGNDEMTKNTGFYIIIGLVLVLVTTIIIINNTKKS